MLGFGRDVFDQLSTGEVRGVFRQAKFADELNASGGIGLAGKTDGAGTDDFRRPCSAPQEVAFRNQVFGTDVEASCSDERFLSGFAPNGFGGIEIQGLAFSESVAQYPATGMVTDHGAGGVVEEFEAAGIVKDVDIANAGRRWVGTEQRHCGEKQADY